MVRRIAVILAIVPALLLFWVDPTVAASFNTRCTNRDVQGLARTGPIGARQTLEGKDTPLSRAWQTCQFRLYDETPHTFTTRDHFLAGIFVYESTEVPGYDRAATIAYLKGVKARLLWARSGKFGQFREVPLTRTKIQSYRLLPESGGRVLLVHHYAIFPAGSLAPGDYTWRLWLYDPIEGPTVYGGTVTIVNR
ncbi:hypothetical protein [Cryptosporangium minutisporangium]